MGQGGKNVGWRNIGPKSRALLGRIGVESIEDLRTLGSVEAYRLAKERSDSVSLNLLWALEGAVSGRDWRDVARDDRERLLRQLG